MAFNDYARSRNRGQPVYLLHFDCGPNLVFGYTTAVQPVERAGVVYEPIPIRFSDVDLKGAPDDADFEIELPRTMPLAEMFTAYPPARPVVLTIYQGNVPNEDDPAEFAEGEMWPVFWRGSVLESARDGATSTLTAQSLVGALDRPGLQSHYQWSCPLALYGARCGADKERATSTASVVTVSGNVLVLADGFQGSFDVAKYLGGVVEWTSSLGTEYRSILRVYEATYFVTETIDEQDVEVEYVGQGFVLSGVPRELEAGSEVTVTLGCGHNMRDCRDVHDNIVNYGGFPYIPGTNPFNKNNHY